MTLRLNVITYASVIAWPLIKRKYRPRIYFFTSTCNFIDKAISKVITIALLLANANAKLTKKLGTFYIEIKTVHSKKVMYVSNMENGMKFKLTHR